MSRIRKAYETQFRWALEQVGTRRLDEGVQWLVDRARRLSAARNISFADALRRVWDGLVIRRRFARKSSPVGIHFFCDAGLGGLARWLRAAGYEAEWHEGIDDDVL